MKKAQFLSIGLLSLFVVGSLTAQDIKYPRTRTVDHVDEYFGVKVPDPYQWLEDDVRESQEVRDWVERQNEIAFGYIKQLPYREEIESRLTELWNYERYSPPTKVADRYFFSKNDGLQNQSVLYRMDSLDSEPVMVIDPNTWSTDGTIALGGLSFSDDGKFLAYGHSRRRFGLADLENHGDRFRKSPRR